MFLQFCEKNRGQLGFGDYKCRTQKTKDHAVFLKHEMQKGYGPHTSGFRGLGFHDFKCPNTNTQQLPNCKK
jgi:hypothetical protein